MDPAALAALLNGPLSARPWVRAAFLFGSRARGTPRPDSDVDVAYVADHDVPLADELALQGALVAATRLPVDLVRLDTASSLLKGQVARDGVVLLERHPFAASRARASAALEWMEFRPTYERAAAAALQRIRDEGRRP